MGLRVALNMKQVLLKPHHFIDIITSFGAGKRRFSPHLYGHNLHIVSQLLLKNPDCRIKLTLDPDDICGPCMHNIAGACVDTIDTSHRPGAPFSKQQWNLLLDHRWCEKLVIKEGDIFSVKKLCEIIQNRMGTITDIYKEFGIERTKIRQALLKEGLHYKLTI
jgi:hypothetical protein